ncbi:MAG: methionyl-tRNA formyltransferase [Armatimonadetes bacterium]|nr:methionyl-tRNA formyltransferase [Armatimonadota bacterium]
MRILFMGTSKFAVPTLQALLNSRHEVIGVVTQPDRPKGRGREVSMSPVKEVALEAGVPIYQPEKVRDENFIKLVEELSPDVIVVAAFGQILPQKLLDIPKYGSINVHASLLPKYRGAAPVHHALFEGETKTGVTTMLMDAGLDTGPILLQREVEILPEDNEGTLEERLANIGAELLIKTLDGLEQGRIQPKPQDHSLATHAPSVKKEDCEIQWAQPADKIVNRIRGCTPRPGAYTYFEGSPLKIWLCRRLDRDMEASPGEIIEVSKEGIVVGTGDGAVLLVEVQPENRRRMTAAEFARGRHITAGMRFDSCSS